MWTILKNMWIFKGKKQAKRADTFNKQEAAIQATRQELYEKITEASKSSRKVSDLLEENRGTTYLIYLATGEGGKRRKNG